MPEEQDINFERLSELTPEDISKISRIMRGIQGPEDMQSVVIDLVKRQSAASRAAQGLQKILDDLLEAPPTLHHTHTVLCEGDGPPRVVITGPGPPRHVLVHPNVDLDRLRNLKPWEYVLVNAEQNVAIGVWADDPELWRQQQGEVVEFKAYRQEGHKDMALVERSGRGVQVVRLVEEVRQEELTAGTQLVLQRDNENWAIGTVPSDHAQSKHEVPLDNLDATLNDLAGLDAIAEQLLEKILVRAVYPDIRDEFGLDPLRGVLLFSNKPGQGKTALIRALAHDMNEIGCDAGFDVVLYSVKPNSLKNKWHGQDAANVRELGANIRARCANQNPSRRLVFWILFDEVESLGSRMGSEDGYISSAQNDVVQALLAELDGLVRDPAQHNDRAVVTFFGLTNRLDMLDPALRRPGRFGDLVLGFPDYDVEGAEGILWKYARKESIPLYVDERVQTGLPEETVRSRILRPALACMFDSPVMYYTTEGQGQRRTEVTSGRVMAGANYWNAISAAKEQAAIRDLRKNGIPAVCCDDLIYTLIEESRGAAAQLVADRSMLRRVLDVKVPVLDAGLMPADEQQEHRYLRLHAS